MKRFEKDPFFDKMDALGLALSFGDVRLWPDYAENLPEEIDVSSRFSINVPLNIPIVSSPMDKVTAHEMAIWMAKLGGLGIIHRGFSAEDQASAVARVKYYLNGLIKKPITFRETDTMEKIVKVIEEKGYRFRSFPILNDHDRVVGLLSGNDFMFCINHSLTAAEVMSKKLFSVADYLPLDEVFNIMQQKKRKVLPVIEKRSRRLKGMYVFSDIRRIVTDSQNIFNLDSNGNLRVGVAVGVGVEEYERAKLCAEKGTDVIVIDTAHGDSKRVYGMIEMLRALKKEFPGVDVVAGNVSRGKAARRLVDAGVDGIRVGQGPGSICTTRVIAGIGTPQVTAIHVCEKAIRGSGVPICGDGGIKYSGDIPIAIAAGADSVMLGNLLAGTKEAPGEVIMFKGAPVKIYRGMGSLSAMLTYESSRNRYQQPKGSRTDLVPEGVEGIVPYKGEVAETLHQLLWGLRKGMGYVGAAIIRELQQKSDFFRITLEGLKESHPSIVMTEDAPNYCQP
jgi:IMP dehydrogenase